MVSECWSTMPNKIKHDFTNYFCLQILMKCVTLWQSVKWISLGRKDNYQLVTSYPTKVMKEQ